MSNPPATLTPLGNYQGRRFRYRGETFVKLHDVDEAVISIPIGQIPVMEIPSGLVTILPASELVIPVPAGSIDFALESTPDIIDELFSRFDHGVFTAVRIGFPKSAQFSTTSRWSGNGHTCMGLAMDTTAVIQRQLRNAAKPGEL